MQKEKQLVPKLRFPEFEGKFVDFKLGEITKIYDGTHQTPKYVEKGIPFYSVEHVSANQFKKTKYISEEVFEKENKRVKLERDDILMTRIGSIGVSKLIDWDVKASFYVSLALIKSPQDYSSKYINQYISSFPFQKELWKRTIHVAFPIKINLGEINYCKIKFPTLPEQQKIADFLSAVDNRIQNLEKKKELLEQYKKGIMQKIFNQEIRFKDDDRKAFPEWKQEKLAYYLKVSKSKNTDLKFSKNDVLSVSGEYGIVNQIEFQGRSFAGASVHNYGIVRNGDIVYTKSPLKSNPYGIIKVNKGVDGIVSTLYAVYKVNKSKADGNFIDYYFQLDDNTNKYLRPLVRKGAKNDMKINNQYVLHDPVLFPSKAEQQKIANFLSAIDQRIYLVNQQIEHTKTYKKGLLQQMFV